MYLIRSPIGTSSTVCPGRFSDSDFRDVYALRTSLVRAHIPQCVPQIVNYETVRVGAPPSRRWPLAGTWTLSQMAQSCFQRELTSGKAATSLEYGRSQCEDVTQVRECGDICDRHGWERDQSRTLPSPRQGASNGSPWAEEAVGLFHFWGKEILVGNFLL